MELVLNVNNQFSFNIILPIDGLNEHLKKAVSFLVYYGEAQYRNTKSKTKLWCH